MATVIVFKDKSTLTLDAALSESHGRAAEVTQNPVEEGADVVDHIQPKPMTLNLTGVVARYPIAGAQTPETEINRILAPVVDGKEPEQNRHMKAFQRLERAVDKRELVTVQTGLKVYENMAIRSATFPRESRTGSDLVFSLELQQVRFATARMVKVPKDAIGKAKPGATVAQAKQQKVKTQAQAQPKVTKGPQAKQAPSAAQTAKAKQMAADTRPKSMAKQVQTYFGLGG